MKNKFKVGDKVKCILKGTDLTRGKTYRVTNVTDDPYLVTIKDDVSENMGGEGWLKNHFEAVNKNPTLTIKKLTRTRKGDEYFTWQFSVKGKVSNHNFNSKQGRDKSLNNFIKYIQENDFKIVNK